jgi:hypothetical protein
VIPGRQIGSAGSYSRSFGRGPTRLMSPASTLKSCGNSSSFQWRSQRPIAVNRWRLETSSRSPSRVRNFTIVNGCPSQPNRLCRNRTGLPDVAPTATATSSRAGMSIGSAADTQTQSKMRLILDRDQALS